MQSATGQYGTQAGEPAQPVQHSVMTAISLGRFLRGVAIPSDFGSIFTTAVDMQCIMTQTPGTDQTVPSRAFCGAWAVRSGPGVRRVRLSQAALFAARGQSGLSPVFAPPSVLQLETQCGIRLIKLRNRTSRLGVLHRLLKRLLAGAWHLGLQLQMTLRDREPIAHFLERD